MIDDRTTPGATPADHDDNAPSSTTAQPSRASRSASKKSSTNFRFTETALARFKGPDTNSTRKSVECSDLDLPGLKAEFGRSGRATYWYRYIWAGAKRAIRLGTVGATSLADARSLAIEARACLDRGVDPQAGSDRLKSMPTLEEFVIQQYLPWAQTAKRSHGDDASRFKHHLQPRFGTKRLIDITARDVDMMKTEYLRSHSPGTTNRLLNLVRAIYRQANLWGVVKDFNPCTGIVAPKEKKGGQRFLTPDEVGRLMIALDADTNRVAADALKLLLLTACRREEILQLRWQAVNLDDGTLKLEHTKNGELRWVQLSRQAIDLLQKQPSKGKSPFVFPGRDGTDRPVNNVRKTLERTQVAAGITEHVHIHTLRHSAASLAVRNGVPLYTVQAMLGHKTATMTQIYAHLADDTVKAGSQTVSDAVSKAFDAAQAKLASAETKGTTDGDDDQEEPAMS